ncbi:MAG: hypothetical protein LM576_06360, partial [Thermofilum sp.]|nr:hypothetical protein [Thermofilum sp.]
MGALRELLEGARRVGADGARAVRGRVGDRFFFIGLASLVWFLLRTGTKPSRIVYPCQRAALANASAWIALYILPLAGALKPSKRLLALSLAALAVAAALAYVAFLRRAPARELELSVESRSAKAEPYSTIFVVQGARGRDSDVLA